MGEASLNLHNRNNDKRLARIPAQARGADDENAAEGLAVRLVLVKDDVEGNGGADDFHHHRPDVFIGRPPRKITCRAEGQNCEERREEWNGNRLENCTGVGGREMP